MSFRRFAVRLILAAVLIQLCTAPTLAFDASPIPQEAADGASPDKAGTPPGEENEESLLDGGGTEEKASGDLPINEDPWPLLDPAELSALVKEYLDAHNLNENNCSIAFCYTGSGESWSYSGDVFILGASLYKLPLMMNVAKKVWSGEFSQDSKINGYDISYIEMRSLTYSDNSISEMVANYFYPFRNYRLMLSDIAGYTEDMLPREYFEDNYFSANFMLGVLKELYYHGEKYPNVVECLLDANPGEFLRQTLDGKYTVAQKYGAIDNHRHIAGIIYTPVPCLVVIMTHYAPYSRSAIGELGEILANYAVTLDKRSQNRHEQLRRANREISLALAEAQTKVLKGERDRFTAEENKHRAEEESRIAAERAEQERREAERQAAILAREKALRPLKIFVILTATMLTVLLTVFLIRLLSRRKKRSVFRSSSRNNTGTE